MAFKRNIRNCFKNLSLQFLIQRSILLLIASWFLGACFFGGIVVRGGQSNQAAIQPVASLTRGVNYSIVCTLDQLESMRNRGDPIPPIQDSGTKNDKNASKTKSSTGAPGAELAHVRLVKRDFYKGGCERDGRSSVFFLLNLLPITDPLDVERAIALSVQAVEGDSMVNLRIWHEIHYYGIVGRVAVWRVRGDVIKYIK